MKLEVLATSPPRLRKQQKQQQIDQKTHNVKKQTEQLPWCILQMLVETGPESSEGHQLCPKQDYENEVF